MMHLHGLLEHPFDWHRASCISAKLRLLGWMARGFLCSCWEVRPERGSVLRAGVEPAPPLFTDVRRSEFGMRRTVTVGEV